jgi:AcrR family transcriptional regulator
MDARGIGLHPVYWGRAPARGRPSSPLLPGGHPAALDTPPEVSYHSNMNEDSQTNRSSQMNKEEEQDRSSRRRARTRANLLVAARKVFAQRGYHDTSIAEITGLADIGVGTFYLYFRDKEELFATLIHEGLQGTREQITAAIQRAGQSTLPTIVETIFHHAYAQRDLFQIALGQGNNANRAFRAQAEIAHALMQVLETAQSEGILAGYDVALLARFITGIIMQGIIWWFTHDEPEPDVMAEQALHLLRNGLPAQLFA